jgi:ankyrin repeat protein
MMELQDWEGLSGILYGSRESSALGMADQCVQHLLSFGWHRFVTLACAAGAELSHDSATVNALISSSEKVAVTSVQLLAIAGIVDVGQASWGMNGLSALHMAAVSGKHRAVSALLDNGADPSARDKDNRTPLHLCCQAMSLSDDLSVKVAMSIVKNYPSSVNDVMQHTLYTPLRFAVEAEKPQLCLCLLQNGADVNARAAEGSTALHECAWSASERGNGRRGEGCKDEERALELAQVLLKCGKVDINLRSCHNSVTALGIAAAHGNFLKMVSLLLDHGADANTSVDDLTALAAAVQHKNLEMVSLLLERGADPNFTVRNVTPLGLAVGLDQHEIAPFLLEHGADPAVAHQGIPLVCCAIYACQHEGENGICPNLTLLLQRGADVTAVAQPPERSLDSPSGWSAVHFAAYKLSTTALNVLLDHNATLSACTEDGETALYIATSMREDNGRVLPMVKELVRHGIDLDATNVFGETALHMTSKFHRDDIREYLLEAGCNSAIQDSSGRTAQDLYNLDEETIRDSEENRRRVLKLASERFKEWVNISARLGTSMVYLNKRSVVSRKVWDQAIPIFYR